MSILRVNMISENKSCFYIRGDKNKFLNLILIFVVFFCLSLYAVSDSYGIIFPLEADKITDRLSLHDGYYNIECAENLVWFANEINSGRIPEDSNAVLSEDIDMSRLDNWKPIGVYNRNKSLATEYKGIFDGNGKVIRNLTCEFEDNYPGKEGVGFIGYLGEGGKVKNLTLEDATINGFACVGGIVGYAVGGKIVEEEVSKSEKIEILKNALVIENCKVIIKSPDKEIKGAGNVGGLIGCGEKNIILKDCENKININGGYSLGGLMGRSLGNVSIINCVNYGEVRGESQEVGGVIGGCEGNLVIYGCKNKGNISLEGIQSGGLVGWCLGDITIIGSSNLGKVRGESSIGGLIGCSSGDINIDASSNCGNVFAEDFVGGLVGWCEGSVEITASDNKGFVEGQGENVAGFVGYGEMFVIIKNSVNSARIKRSGETIFDLLCGDCDNEIENSYYMEGGRYKEFGDTEAVLKAEEVVDKLNGYIEKDEEINRKWVLNIAERRPMLEINSIHLMIFQNN